LAKHTKAGTYCVHAEIQELIEFCCRIYASQFRYLEYDSIAVPASPAAGTWNYTTGID